MPRDCRDAIWFEDYRVGDAFESAPVTFTEPDIIDFGKRYDPQPSTLIRTPRRPRRSAA
jgi:hypothetical protein